MSSKELRDRLLQIANAESKVASGLVGGYRTKGAKDKKPRKARHYTDTVLHEKILRLEDLIDLAKSRGRTNTKAYAKHVASLRKLKNGSGLVGGRRSLMHNARSMVKSHAMKQAHALLRDLLAGVGASVPAGSGYCRGMRDHDMVGGRKMRGRALSDFVNAGRASNISSVGGARIGGARIGGNVQAQLKAMLQEQADQSKQSYAGGRRPIARKIVKHRISMSGGRRPIARKIVKHRMSMRGEGLTPYSIYVKDHYQDTRAGLEEEPDTEIRFKNGRTVRYGDLVSAQDKNRAVFAELGYSWSMNKPFYGVDTPDYIRIKQAGVYTGKRNTGKSYKKRSTKKKTETQTAKGLVGGRQSRVSFY